MRGDEVFKIEAWNIYRIILRSSNSWLNGWTHKLILEPRNQFLHHSWAMKNDPKFFITRTSSRETSHPFFHYVCFRFRLLRGAAPFHPRIFVLSRCAVIWKIVKYLACPFSVYLNYGQAMPSCGCYTRNPFIRWWSPADGKKLFVWKTARDELRAESCLLDSAHAVRGWDVKQGKGERYLVRWI